MLCMIWACCIINLSRKVQELLGKFLENITPMVILLFMTLLFGWRRNLACDTHLLMGRETLEALMEIMLRQCVTQNPASKRLQKNFLLILKKKRSCLLIILMAV